MRFICALHLRDATREGRLKDKFDSFPFGMVLFEGTAMCLDHFREMVIAEQPVDLGKDQGS